MKTERVSFYKDFKCIEGNCGENCCTGWIVPVDNETWEKYASLKGLDFLRLRLENFHRSEPVFVTGANGCRFRNREGLCSMQLKYGEEMIPAVCRAYPRRRRNYGVQTVSWLDLSCIEAARMFLERSGRVEWEFIDEKNAGARWGNNDDEDFFKCLCFSREKILKLLDETEREISCEKIDDTFRLIHRFAIGAQGACINSDRDFFDKPLEALENFADDKASEKSFREKYFQGIYFPYSGETMHTLFRECFYSSTLKKRIPFLYKVCGEYTKHFETLLGAQKTQEYEKCIELFLSGYPELLPVWLNYYRYCLMQYYYNIYEDYSFSKWLLRAVTDCNMFMMLCAMYERQAGKLSLEDCAHILAVFERRSRHNRDVSEKMNRGVLW